MKEVRMAARTVFRHVFHRSLRSNGKHWETEKGGEHHANSTQRPGRCDAVQANREAPPVLDVSQLLVAEDADYDREKDAGHFTKGSHELKQMTPPSAGGDEESLNNVNIVDVYDDNFL
ncbi:hypothetical protein ILYODFUR_033566 [Ilyodon furcidens]|uniref:Uncharacterized protein n=1 Tax=Ilyodon furcidens TaxID=33524 RepID=A0ABV0U162_9TELE